MGLELFPPEPERDFSWEELGDPTGPQRHGQDDSTSMAWRIVATLLFVTGLVLCAAAFLDDRWYLWVVMLVPLAIVGMMASHALTNMVRDGELDPVEPAWGARSKSPSL